MLTTILSNYYAPIYIYFCLNNRFTYNHLYLRLNSAACYWKTKIGTSNLKNCSRKKKKNSPWVFHYDNIYETTYKSVVVGIPEQCAPVSSGRAGQIKEERIGTPWRVANAFDVTPNVQLVGRFHVADGRRVLGSV